MDNLLISKLFLKFLCLGSNLPEHAKSKQPIQRYGILVPRPVCIQEVKM